MAWRWTPYALVLFSLSIGCCGVAIYLRRRHNGLGTQTLALLLVALALWDSAYALQCMRTDVAGSLLWAQIGFIATATVPVLGLVFSLQYSTAGRLPTTFGTVSLFLVPVTTIILVFAAPTGGPIYSDVTIVQGHSSPIMPIGRGWWFWVHTAYSYLALCGGMVLIIDYMRRGPKGTIRSQIIRQLIVASVIPIMFSLLFLIGPGDLSDLDLSPATVSMSAIWVTFVLIRQRMLSTLPAAQLAVFSQVSDGVAVLDAQDRVVEINPAAERILGVRRRDMLGRCLGAGMGLDPAGCMQLAESADQGIVTLDVGGHQRILDVRSSELAGPADQRVGRLFLIGDITDRIMAERQTARGLAEMTALIENLHLGVLVHDQDRQIHHANRYLCEVFGIECGPDSMVGKKLEDAGRMITDQCQEPQELLSAARGAYGRGESVEGHDILLLDGRTIECRGFPTEYQGTDGSYLWLFRDVTAQRAMAQRSRDILRMKAVGTLAGGMAHEFNNLLTVVNGYGEMLRSRFRSDPEITEEVDEILAAGARAAELTKQLLAYSRRQMLRIEPVELGAILSEAMPVVRQLLQADSTAEIALELGGADVWARGDREQIVQVVLQLVSNALDVIPENGRVALGTLVQDVVDERATRLGLPPGRYGAIYVRDTGPGIEPGIREHLFEPFFSTKGVGGGTGLGLAMADGVMRQSGGAIDVETRIGHGSTFLLLFPLRERPTDAMPDATAG